MSGGDDWAPGDLALCVDDSPLRAAYFIQRGMGFPVRAGAVLTVRSLGLSETNAVGLLFEDLCFGFYDRSGREIVGHPRRFRKIHPLTDEERDEFLADIKQPGRISA